MVTEQKIHCGFKTSLQAAEMQLSTLCLSAAGRRWPGPGSLLCTVRHVRSSCRNPSSQPSVSPPCQAISQGTGTTVDPGAITKVEATSQALNDGQEGLVEAVVVANSAAFSEVKTSTASALATAVADVCGGGSASAEAKAIAEAVSKVSPV